MSIILLLLRLLLASVFLTSGLAKLIDRKGSKQAILDFGLPAFLAAPFGFILPLVELVIAGSLVFVVTAWWGAIGASGMLLLFIIGIAANLARGRTPDCHCFGQLHSEPIGWSTLTRNLILILMAGVIFWQGSDNVGLSIGGLLGTLTAIQLFGLNFAVLVLALLAVEGWFLVHLLRQNGRLLLRIESLETQLASESLNQPHTISSSQKEKKQQMGLPIGMPAPTFRLANLQNEIITLESLLALGKPLLLIFSDPKCGPCIALMPKVADWQRDYAGLFTIAIISQGPLKDNHIKFAKYGLANVFVQKGREIADAYETRGTPSAVLVLPNGKVGSAVVSGAEAISKLAEEVLNRPSHQQFVQANRNGKTNVQVQANGVNGIAIGDVAPSFKLTDLNGNIVSLSDFRGSKTLILFWNPTCGFCQRMLNDLKAWERNVSQEALKLLIVSTGTIEANQEMQLQSSIILDQGFTIGHRYGATGTPSAMLVDVDGKVASEVAIGAKKISTLVLGQGAMSMRI